MIDALGAGTNFGELAPLFGLGRSATAVALERSRLTSLSVSDFCASFVP